MRCVQAPDRTNNIIRPYVFLAGGITNCRDWQAEVVTALSDVPHGTLFNPRCEISPKAEEVEAQIRWEFERLWSSDIIVFWFSRETLCPITLYELGTHLSRKKFSHPVEICIGIDKGYERATDVRVQASLMVPQIPVVDAVADLAAFVRRSAKS